MASKIPVIEFSYSKNQVVPITIVPLSSIALGDKAGKPNRHTFHEIFLISSGKGTHTIDFNEQSIEPNTVFLVSPYQVHHWTIEESLSGYVILFEDSALLSSAAKELLPGIYCHDKFTIENGDMMAELITKTKELEKELLHMRALHKDMSSLQLQLLLLSLTRVKEQNTEDVQARPATLNLALSFTRLASRHYIQHRQSKWYADKLNTSTSYLSQVVKNETGGTPGEYIRSKTISEIKRQLLYTDLSVEMIAKDMHFESSSYFGRFFRRETGQTPREFAKSTRQS